MRNVRFLLSYHGARFYGWQRQDGFDSVQQALEEAVLGATGQTVSAHGAGRTDTGVHALGQVASLHLDTRLDDERLWFAVNAHLPPGVVARACETCADDFHARFHARSKRYAYTIASARFEPVLGADQAWWTPWPFDVARMRRAASALVGRHDFAAFGNTGSPRSSTVRTVLGVRWIARRGRVTFVIQGDGFLYNMVRTIAGTLLDVGRGKLDESAVARALTGGERAELGPTAPAAGLCLVSVQYPERPFTARPPRIPRGAVGSRTGAAP